MKANKKGLSGVVTVVILIALAIALVAIVWAVVNNLVTKQLGEAGSCFGTFDKITINQRFTCYNSSSGELQFSINIGDIEVDDVLVAVASQGTSSSFTISKNPGTVDNIVSYPSRNAIVNLPGKNGGLTYILNMSAAGFTGKPASLQIAPIIGGNQCETSDSLNEFDDCSTLIP